MTTGASRPDAGDCRGGQVTLEYAMMLAVVLAAVMGMELYAKRGIERAVKQAADRFTPCSVPSPACPTLDRTGEWGQLDGLLFESGDRRVKNTVRAGQVLVSDSGTLTRTSDPGAVTTRAVRPGGVVQRSTQEETVTEPQLIAGSNVVAYSETVADVLP